MATLETLARRCLPPALARMTKRFVVYPRYLLQVRACRKGYRQFGGHYPHRILFVAGLPKSGTTWLKRMLSAYPGFHELLIPDVAGYELRTGGSHDYGLPDDTFSRFKHMLVVTKMHVHGSPHNTALLRAAQIRHVVLFRDLRDVAVSHYFYVRQTPWHPEYPLYRRLSVEGALLAFADRTLLPFAAWVRSWHDNCDPELCLLLRYEELLKDRLGAMTRVAQHFGLDSSPATVGAIVDQHSFQRLSGGRQPGQQSANSFFRKGVSGDWRNHFTPVVTDRYKQLIGDFLIEFGYEQDREW